jgi:hypothetical protein
MLGEALGAVAALEQKGLAGRDLGEGALELPRLTGKNQRRKACELTLDALERRRVRISRHLLDGFPPPAIGRPPLAHRPLPLLSLNCIVEQGAAYSQSGPRKPVDS